VDLRSSLVGRSEELNGNVERSIDLIKKLPRSEPQASSSLLIFLLFSFFFLFSLVFVSNNRRLHNFRSDAHHSPQECVQHVQTFFTAGNRGIGLYSLSLAARCYDGFVFVCLYGPIVWSWMRRELDPTIS
jgi:hypothetical protein